MCSKTWNRDVRPESHYEINMSKRKERMGWEGYRGRGKYTSTCRHVAETGAAGQRKGRSSKHRDPYDHLKIPRRKIPAGVLECLRGHERDSSM